MQVETAGDVLALRAEMGGMFSELRGFIDRRIAELSAEVHATVQLSSTIRRRTSPASSAASTSRLPP
jgi:hypothetical protein